MEPRPANDARATAITPTAEALYGKAAANVPVLFLARKADPLYQTLLPLLADIEAAAEKHGAPGFPSPAACSDDPTAAYFETWGFKLWEHAIDRLETLAKWATKARPWWWEELGLRKRVERALSDSDMPSCPNGCGVMALRWINDDHHGLPRDWKCPRCGSEISLADNRLRCQAPIDGLGRPAAPALTVFPKDKVGVTGAE